MESKAACNGRVTECLSVESVARRRGPWLQPSRRSQPGLWQTDAPLLAVPALGSLGPALVQRLHQAGLALAALASSEAFCLASE